MKQIFFVLGLFLFSLSTLLAQDGAIRGNVVTANNSSAASVTVMVKGTMKAAVTDDRGNFLIRKLPAGNYTLKISLLDFETTEQTVTVEAGKTAEIAIQLKLSDKELQEVKVTNSRNSLSKISPYVAKMPLKNMENPQVYNTVSAELLKQQVITNYDDGLKNVPGIQRLWESTGRGGDGGSYFTLRGFEVQATLINGLPGLTNGNLDPANIEKIEVIKGPSGTLFGSNGFGYGGIINNITKKPYADFGGEITYTSGSYGLNRVAADINIPLQKEKGIAARINTAYQNENSFQDQGFRKSFFLAPTLSYKVNEKLSFLFVSEFMQEEKTNPMMLFLGRDTPLQFEDLQDLNYNKKLSLTSNDLSIKNPSYNLQGQMMYKLSSQWTSQTVLSRGQSNSDGYYTYLYDNENANRDFSLWVTKENSYTTTSDIQQNFIGDFNMGAFRNRIVAGLDYFERKVIYSGTGWDRIHSVNAQGEINYLDPVTGIELEPVYLTKQSVDNLLAGSGSGAFSSANKVYSAYVSDVFNITPALLAMASLRVDRFDDPEYKQTALSPKFGLLYQPLQDKLSVFVNYMNGFRNIGPMEIADPDGSNKRAKSFEPEQANQLEFGIKASILGEKLTSTISYYDIRVANQTMPDPDNQFNTIQGGKSRSRGLEFDINATPVEGFNILVGYSYNYSNVLKGEVDNIWFEEGKRPIWAGSKNLFNAWATYTFNKGAINGLGLGAGANYASENATLNNTKTGVFLLPSYTIINGSVFYNTEKFRVTCNLNNLGNKDYYGGGWSTINPQKPRNFVASFAFKF